MKSFLVAFLAGLSLIFLGNNLYQYNKEFNRCEELTKATKRNLAKMHLELVQLHEAVYGTDYYPADFE